MELRCGWIAWDREPGNASRKEGNGENSTASGRDRPTARRRVRCLSGWLVWCSRGPAGDPVGARRTEAELVKKGTSGGGGARVSVALFSGSGSPGGAARFAFASPPRRRGVITLATVTRVAGGRYPGGGHLVSDLSVPPPLPPFFVLLVRPPDFRRRVNQDRRSLAGEDRSIIVLVSDLGDARARRAGCRCRW